MMGPDLNTGTGLILRVCQESRHTLLPPPLRGNPQYRGMESLASVQASPTNKQALQQSLVCQCSPVTLQWCLVGKTFPYLTLY